MADKESVMTLELVGGVFVVERFEDGTERREELDGEVVLRLVVSTLERALDREAPLKKKLANTRMEYVSRKGERRKVKVMEGKKKIGEQG